MTDITTRTVRERRMDIDGGPATVSREGRRITISHGYAGRFTKENQHFYVEDIERLAQFIKDTDQ